MSLPVDRRDLLKWSVASMLASTEESPAAVRKPTALLADPVYTQHETGPGHPERPERYTAVTQALDDAGLTKSFARVPVRVANEDELALVHTRPYIQIVKRDTAAGAQELSTGDTTLGPHSLEVALRAV